MYKYTWPDLVIPGKKSDKTDYFFSQFFIVLKRHIIIVNFYQIEHDTLDLQDEIRYETDFK